jgi:hypothetical protein
VYVPVPEILGSFESQETVWLSPIAARYLGLTDENLAILGPIMLIVAGVIIRAGVFAPDTVRDLLEPEEQDES